MNLFVGQYECELDRKSRLKLPESFIAILDKESYVPRSMCLAMQKTLCIYTDKMFGEIVRGIYYHQTSQSELDVEKEEAIAKFLATQQQVRRDRKGRLKFPIMNKFTYIGSDNMYLVGCGNHIEIWDRAAWERYEGLDEKPFIYGITDYLFCPKT